jgi:hypothetical protein
MTVSAGSALRERPRVELTGIEPVKRDFGLPREKERFSRKAQRKQGVLIDDRLDPR